MTSYVEVTITWKKILFWMERSLPVIHVLATRCLCFVRNGATRGLHRAGAPLHTLISLIFPHLVQQNACVSPGNAGNCHDTVFQPHFFFRRTRRSPSHGPPESRSCTGSRCGTWTKAGGPIREQRAGAELIHWTEVPSIPADEAQLSSGEQRPGCSTEMWRNTCHATASGE